MKQRKPTIDHNYTTPRPLQRLLDYFELYTTPNRPSFDIIGQGNTVWDVLRHCYAANEV